MTSKRRWGAAIVTVILIVLAVRCGPGTGAGNGEDATGGPPPGGRPDAGGFSQPVVLASDQNLPTRIFADGERVFWTRTSESADYAGLYSVPCAGGLVEKLATFSASEASFDGNAVYFPLGDTLRRVSKTGGTERVLVEGQAQAHAVAVGASSLFWARTELSQQQVLMAAAKDGTEVRSLAVSDTPIESTLATEGAVYWATGNAGECYIGVSSQNSGTLQRTDLASGTTKPLVTGICNTVALAEDATHVYLATAGSLLRVPKSGGAHEVLEASAPGVTALVVDDQSVYWTYDWKSLERESKLMRRVKDSSGLAVALYELGIPGPLAREGRSLFWIGRGSASVMRMDH